MNIRSVVHDFEDAIINAIKKAFKSIKFHFCCWFHFKKALREHADIIFGCEDKMRKFKSDFLALFDFLTVVERDLIPLGVDWIKKQAKKLQGYRGQKARVEEFFGYFERQWLTDRLIPLWNYNGAEGWQEVM